MTKPGYPHFAQLKSTPTCNLELIHLDNIAACNRARALGSTSSRSACRAASGRGTQCCAYAWAIPTLGWKRSAWKEGEEEGAQQGTELDPTGNEFLNRQIGARGRCEEDAEGHRLHSEPQGGGGGGEAAGAGGETWRGALVCNCTRGWAVSNWWDMSRLELKAPFAGLVPGSCSLRPKANHLFEERLSFVKK